MTNHTEPQARDAHRTYDASNRWDSAERVPHTGYAHAEPMSESEVTERTETLARELFARLDETGNTDGLTVADIAESVRDRIRWERERIARSAHVMFHADRTTGDTERHSPVPDVSERVRATVKTRRTNSGRTEREVIRHGRAYVIGSADGLAPNREHAMSTEHAAAMLASIPRATVGADAMSVYRATESLYGRSVPALIGGDVLTFHEFPDTGSVRVGKYRPARFGSRYRLPMPTPRTGEPSTRGTGELLGAADTVAERRTVDTVDIRDEHGRLTERRSGRTVVSVAPSRRAWRGHTLTERPVSVRERRASRARGVDESIVLAETDGLAETLSWFAEHAPSGRPYRVTWSRGEQSGALTVSGEHRRRYSVTGLGVDVRGRTVAGLARAIARAE